MVEKVDSSIRKMDSVIGIVPLDEWDWCLGCSPDVGRGYAVYAVVFDDEIQYIGKTIDLHSRYSGHKCCGALRGVSEHSLFMWHLCRDAGEATKLELELIRATIPNLNVLGKVSPGEEKMVCFLFSSSLWHAFRGAAILHGMTVKAALHEALILWLSSRSVKVP